MRFRPMPTAGASLAEWRAADTRADRSQEARPQRTCAQPDVAGAGWSRPGGGRAFHGAHDTDYDDVILESARAVIEARDRAGLLNANRLSLVHPEVYLTEPALYRPAYSRAWLKVPPEHAAAGRVVRMIQSQRSFRSEVTPDVLRLLTEHGVAQSVLIERQVELDTFMAGVG